MTEDGWRTKDGKWKIGQCSVGPETAKILNLREGVSLFGFYLNKERTYHLTAPVTRFLDYNNVDRLSKKIFRFLRTELD